MPLQLGTTLGPYQVTAKIGEGRVGEAYQARTPHARPGELWTAPEAGEEVLSWAWRRW